MTAAEFTSASSAPCYATTRVDESRRGVDAGEIGLPNDAPRRRASAISRAVSSAPSARAVVVHGDAHAARAERERDGATDAAARAGDERDAAARAASSPRQAAGARPSAASRSSWRRSHSAGTCIMPSVRGPSAAPCQSEPPLGTSRAARRSAREPRRCPAASGSDAAPRRRRARARRAARGARACRPRRGARGRETAGGVHHRDRVAHRQLILGDVRRASRAEVAVERVAQVGRPAVGDQRARDVRPADRAVAGLRSTSSSVDLHAERAAAARRSRSRARRAHLAQLPEPRSSTAVSLQMEAEQVRLARRLRPRSARRRARRGSPSSRAGRGAPRRARHRVVVGERDRGERRRAWRRATTSAGERDPSDAVECMCRSTNGGRSPRRLTRHERVAGLGRREARLRLLEQARRSASLSSASDCSRERAPCGE